MKAIAIPSAGGITGRGDRDAFVGNWSAARRSRELADDPAAGQLIIENDWVAGAAVLACTAEAAPDGRDAIGPQDRISRGLVENLKAFVDDLHVLRCSHLAIRIGRCAVASDAWKGDTVKIEDGARDVRNQET
ncbi:MAG TPA: hypothetical protein DCK99_13180 [Blastocatellia bacterium]|nr:hypothetical protein [Blastocatellia bacterium]